MKRPPLTPSLLILCFPFLSGLASAFAAPHLSLDSAAAPTHFTETLDLQKKSQNTSLRFRSIGLDLSTHTPSIRGSAPAETAVFLEGIRLNSPASGDFDLSLLSPLGLESATLLKGPHAVWASNASGSLHFQLPREDSYEAKALYGSYHETALSLAAPIASLSLERSDGNYLFKHDGQKHYRSHNAAQRFNFRAWKRGRVSVLAQFLHSDQESPGSMSLPTPHATLQTFQPLLGFSVREKTWWASSQIQYQNQNYENPDYSNESLNEWIESSISLTKASSLSDDIYFETGFSWEAAQLWTRSDSRQGRRNTESPLRHSLSLHQIWTLSPLQHLLLQPLIKADFISDLHREKIFPHAGVGLRYEGLSPLSLLTNLSFGSRPPNFNEMYFEEIPFIEGNRRLRRQKTLATDLGYEWKKAEFMTWQQAFFIQRRDAYLQDDPSSDPYKILNRGTAISLGIENILKISFDDSIEVDLAYTWQRARLNDHESDYQAAHTAASELRWRPWKTTWLRSLELSSPLSIRSRVRAGENLQTSEVYFIDPQVNWGAGLLYSWSLFTFQFSAENILSASLIEVRGYPLSSEPSYRGSLSAKF